MKRILYLPLALVAIFILSGCGGGQGTTGSDNNSAGGDESLPTAEAPRVGGATDEDEGAFRPTAAKIAYVKGGTLFLYDAEKGLSTPLTREGVEVFTCTFLPGRDEICYTAVEEDGKLSLRSITLADGEPMARRKALYLGISVSDCTAKDGSNKIGALWGLPDGGVVQRYKWMIDPVLSMFSAGKLIDVNRGRVVDVDEKEIVPLRHEMYERYWQYLFKKKTGELTESEEEEGFYTSENLELMYRGACLTCDLKLKRPEGFLPSYGFKEFSPDNSKLLFLTTFLNVVSEEYEEREGPWCLVDTDGKHQVNLGESSPEYFLTRTFIGKRLLYEMRDYYGKEEWHLDLYLTDAGDNSPSVVVKDISYWCVQE